jgi:hypothetical protein
MPHTQKDPAPRPGSLSRRDLAALLPLAGAGAMAQSAPPLPGKPLDAPAITGSMKRGAGDPPWPGAAWYETGDETSTLVWNIPPGSLGDMKWLAADMLLDGSTLAVFQLSLREAGDKGRTFRLSFGALNQCSFRMRMSAELVNQNRWMAGREGAFLKPIAGGDRIDLDKVDRLTLSVRRKGPGTVRWAMTPLYVSTAEVPPLDKPLLPKGPLIDEFGQSTLHDWPAKTRSEAELKRRIQTQLQQAPKQEWPGEFTRWGGWKQKKLGEATGFFRTAFDGRRWWLADPDGYAFWSTGPDCVRVDCEARYDGLETALKWLPDSAGEFAAIFRSSERGGLPGKYVNYLAANLIRSLGASGWREKWATIALAELKRLRFNTVANWSDWEYASKARFPYVRPMSFRGSRAPMIYRDFPDVFAPGFEQDAGDYAAQLKSSAGDPAFIGYFLMNEPTWGFSSELPAAGMLFNTETCSTREQLARWLKAKYPGDGALAAAWNMPVGFERIARGRFSGVLTAEALKDLRDFSVQMVERYFSILSAATRKADPNHLNLGMRWAGVPPEWAVAGMKFFDVFSLNCYMEKLPLDQSRKINDMLGIPVMVGEWHFGALDAGLPASGIGHLRNQTERAKAYRVYLEDAAANPLCVGAHWFTLYDQSALGRFDGENYNIGFLDICNRPYAEICAAAAASHERMYQVASGTAEPFSDAPEYLPILSV